MKFLVVYFSDNYVFWYPKFNLFTKSYFNTFETNKYPFMRPIQHMVVMYVVIIGKYIQVSGNAKRKFK